MTTSSALTAKTEVSDLDLAKIAVHDALTDFKVFLQWVRTKDEVEGWGNRPFPVDKQYIMWLADRLQSREGLPRTVWIPKSRRLMLTWTMCAYILWRGIKNGATHSFLQSKKLDDADFLVKERCAYIYDKLPYWFKYVAFGGLTKPHVKEAKLQLPNGAMIWGFPQGPDVARQFTPSIIFIDEAASQDQLKDAVTAIMPLVEKQMELYFVSTAKVSYMGEVVTGEPASEIDQPLKGIRTWRLKHGGNVWEIHHTADPIKDPVTEKGQQWLEQQDEKFIGGIDGSDWHQEMNIDWGAKAGDLVYDSYSDTIGQDGSSVVEPFDLSLFEERYAVIDWGIRNPTAVLWIGRLDNIWYIYREYCEVPQTVESFKKMFWHRSVFYDDEKRIRGEDFQRILIDPASDRRDDPQARTVFNLLRVPGKYQMNAVKANRSDDGVMLVREWLAQGRLKVFKDCTRTRWEFKRLRHMDWNPTTQTYHNLKEAIVDKDNHTMDCIKYFANLMRVREMKVHKQRQADPVETEIDRIISEGESKRQYYRHGA